MEILVRKPTTEERAHLERQPTWSSEVSTFDWHYSTREVSLITRGQVTITYGERKITLKEGDYVEFPAGLSCVWEVTEPLTKHYILD